METLRAKRESAVRSVRVREAHDRIARQGKIPGGGPRWFGWTRVYANPDASPRQRVILRLDVNEAEAAALRDAVGRILRGETIYSIVCEWEAGGIRPVASGHWTVATLAGILCSPRLAGLREWQGKKYPAQWPAIIDADTHERLARLLADRPRRAQVTGKKRHLLSGVLRCGKCGRPLYVDLNRYRCASGPGLGCGGVSVRSDMIEEYVTGAVLDALESPRVQEAVAAGQDTDAPRRAELLAEIRRAQEKRAEARRDWAEDVIDKEDWLDVKQRTDDRINRARKEYDRLTGTTTVFGDIPPSDAVRDAWQDWNTDRRRAAVKAVLNQVTVSPDTPGRRGTRDRALRVDALRQRTEFDWRL